MNASIFTITLLSACTPKADPEKSLSDSDIAVTSDSSDSQNDSVTDTTETALPSDTGRVVGPLTFSESPQNMIVITLDTLRRDALGEYSATKDASPFLDALLATSVSLADHRSCSDWTWESLLCAQGGRLPYRLGFPWSGETGGSVILPEDTPLVSTAMRDLGYQTSLVSAQPFLGSGSGLRAGFQSVRYEPNQPASWVVASAGRALEALDRAQPWYLHLHFMDPHHLYVPPAEYLDALDALPPSPFDLTSGAGYDEMERAWSSLSDANRDLVRSHLQARYAGEVRYLDDQLAALWEVLERGGWLEDTLVMLWSDHGEQLYQHGSANHGAGLYDEESRAVALFWSADLTTPGAWTEPTTHLDLWPTAFAALDVSPDLTLDGHPLGSRPAREPSFAIHYRGPDTDQSVVLDGQKLLFRWTGEVQRYDLTDDPDETVDRFVGDKEDAALWSLLLPEVEAAHAAAGGAEPIAPSLLTARAQP